MIVKMLKTHENDSNFPIVSVQKSQISDMKIGKMDEGYYVHVTVEDGRKVKSNFFPTEEKAGRFRDTIAQIHKGKAPENLTQRFIEEHAKPNIVPV